LPGKFRLEYLNWTLPMPLGTVSDEVVPAPSAFDWPATTNTCVTALAGLTARIVARAASGALRRKGGNILETLIWRFANYWAAEEAANGQREDISGSVGGPKPRPRIHPAVPLRSRVRERR